MASATDHACRGVVLVVDNTPGTSELCRNHLEPEGFRVFITEIDHQGIKGIQRILPDVLLLELPVPGIDGFKIIEQLKADEATRDIPVLVYCLRHTAAAVEKALLMGADDFLTNPVAAHELIARINKLLRFKQTRELLRSPVEDLIRSQLAITRALKKWEQETEAFRKQCESIIIKLLREAGLGDQIMSGAEPIMELIERIFSQRSEYDVLH